MSEKYLPWILGIAGVLVVLAGLFWLTDIFRAPSQPSTNLSAFFVWRVYDESLTEEQAGRFYQRYLAAKIGLEDNPDLFAGWLNLGEAKLAVEDYEGARDAWEYLSDIRPLNSLSFGNLASLYTYNLYAPEKAELNYRQAIANSQGEPVNASYYRNFTEFQLNFLKDESQAEAILLEGIAANPESSDLLKVLGGIYQVQGRVSEAIAYYELSLELSPGDEAVRQELERLRAQL